MKASIEVSAKEALKSGLDNCEKYEITFNPADLRVEILFNHELFPDGPAMPLIWSFQKTVIGSLVSILVMCRKMNGLKI